MLKQMITFKQQQEEFELNYLSPDITKIVKGSNKAHYRYAENQYLLTYDYNPATNISEAAKKNCLNFMTDRRAIKMNKKAILPAQTSFDINY